MIIAIDYDKTIDAAPFPFIGIPVPGAIEKIKELKINNILILNTCRKGVALTNALKFLKTNNIDFDYINENEKNSIKKFGDTRKIFADIYIDDKSYNAPLINMTVRRSKTLKKPGSKIIKVFDWSKFNL